MGRNGILQALPAGARSCAGRPRDPARCLRCGRTSPPRCARCGLLFRCSRDRHGPVASRSHRHPPDAFTIRHHRENMAGASSLGASGNSCESFVGVIYFASKMEGVREETGVRAAGLPRRGCHASSQRVAATLRRVFPRRASCKPCGEAPQRHVATRASQPRRCHARRVPAHAQDLDSQSITPILRGSHFVGLPSA